MDLFTIRNTIQHFVDEHLPGQSVTHIEVRWNVKADRMYLYVDVDDYDIVRALEEIDDETASDLVGLYDQLIDRYKARYDTRAVFRTKKS